MSYPVYNTFDDLIKSIPKYSAQQNYLAMYSSIFAAITTEPQFMMVPVDDHLVHRGDGVFEAFKMVNSKIYLLQAHLDRLERSAQTIGLELKHSQQEITQICQQLAIESKSQTGLFRLYAARGPGSFSPNPFESIGPQMYIVLTVLKEPVEAVFEQGVTAGFSKIAVKSGGMARTKTCNYITNVLMNKEAVETGYDFMINITADGFLGEGATENIVYLNKQKQLIFSSFEHTLRGTTLLRLQELSENLVAQGLIVEMLEAKQSFTELENATEAFFIGTSLDAVPLVKLNGKAIGSGKPGAVTQAARKLLQYDQQHGSVAFSIN